MLTLALVIVAAAAFLAAYRRHRADVAADLERRRARWHPSLGPPASHVRLVPPLEDGDR